MTSAHVIWAVMGAGVIAYVLTAGADFGGGMWHLFAAGKRAPRERAAIEHAIAPIWEANHVWLIFVIVMMFTAFPRAYAVVSTALHIPLALALLGIVIRGSAFVFHAYDVRPREGRGLYSVAFGLSSLVTPVFLGDVLGALSTGEIRWDGRHVTTGFLAGWTSPFALLTGVFAAVLFALLAAVYLTVDARDAPDGPDTELARAFRRRALALEVVAGALAFVVLMVAAEGAPRVHESVSASSWALPLQLGTAAAALATVGLLWIRRYHVARVTVAVQVALVVVGWGLAMRGDIVTPDVTLANAGVHAPAVEAVLLVVALGSVLLLPSLWYLFRVFKAR
jgi:cytochrome d ubiquinol oxidase subunit II